MLTTAEAAAALQVSRRRVSELIRLGTLEAEKFGRDWQVDSASVEAYKNSPRKAGPKFKKKRIDSRIDSFEQKEAPDTAASKASLSGEPRRT